jgi:hypothetical protein
MLWLAAALAAVLAVAVTTTNAPFAWRMQRSDASLRAAAAQVLHEGAVPAGRYGWIDVRAMRRSGGCVIVETARLGVDGLLYCPEGGPTDASPADSFRIVDHVADHWWTFVVPTS